MGLSGHQIGDRIRYLRKERAWTLQELSGRAGISLSALSKIENAQVAATFDTLTKVARGLGVEFDVLLSQAPGSELEMQTSRGVGRLVVTRKADAVGFSTEMYEYEVHANALRRKYMTPLIMEVKARSAADVTSWSSHEGEEFIYVLKGTITLNTEFYEPVVLEAGDSAYIDSGMAHMFLNRGKGAAVMASICYSSSLDRPLLPARTDESGGALSGGARELLGN